MKVGIGIGVGQLHGTTGDGYGPELVVDGGFDLGISQVTAKRAAVLSWNNSNSLMVTYGGTTEPQGWLTLNTIAGRPYRVLVDITQAPGTGILRVFAADQTTSLASAAAIPTGTRELLFTATGSTSYLALAVNASILSSTIFDNVSVREVL